MSTKIIISGRRLRVVEVKYRKRKRFTFTRYSCMIDQAHSGDHPAEFRELIADFVSRQTQLNNAGQADAQTANRAQPQSLADLSGSKKHPCKSGELAKTLEEIVHFIRDVNASKNTVAAEQIWVVCTNVLNSLRFVLDQRPIIMDEQGMLLPGSGPTQRVSSAGHSDSPAEASIDKVGEPHADEPIVIMGLEEEFKIVPQKVREIVRWVPIAWPNRTPILRLVADESRNDAYIGL